MPLEAATLVEQTLSVREIVAEKGQGRKLLRKKDFALVEEVKRRRKGRKKRHTTNAGTLVQSKLCGFRFHNTPLSEVPFFGVQK